jgi:signal transduction histidine kinase
MSDLQAGFRGEWPEGSGRGAAGAGGLAHAGSQISLMIELGKVPSELFAPILAGNLRQVGPSRKLFAHFLEAVRLRLGADAVWVTRAGPGERMLPGGRLQCGGPELCDGALAGEFLRHEHPVIPPGVVLAVLAVHGRHVAAVGAARREGDLAPAARRTLERLCGVLAQELARREEERLDRVLDRIREKVVSELRPRDLAYQILDGLHQLVDYDHSSAFLAYDSERAVFRIEAEKIVWTKAKSPFVGREIRLSAERIGRIGRAIEILAPGGAAALAVGGGAAIATAGGGDGFEELLDYHREAGIPPVSSLLSAPLFYDGEFLGILKVASWQRPPFSQRDLEVVERFLPAAAVSMRNARVNRSLEMQAIESEVKASLVTLSHAVAHDVNNAVGSILPLAQQMRFDLRHGGPFDAESFDRDLEVIIDNARLCQRIFSNMLRVAGAGRASDYPVDAAQVVAETMPFLLALAGRRGIEIALDLAPGLPPVRVWRQDLQHIVLNLVRNSLQALSEPGERGERPERAERAVPDPAGDRAGRVEIAVRGGDGGSVELSVADDGPGIPAELLSKVQEPFFSTRPGGTGLGLALCRALAWQNGGSLIIESPIAAVEAPGAPPDGALGAFASGLPGGTRVTLRLGAEPPRDAV